MDEDECITDGISEEKLGETCNYMGKQISIWMMKLEQEKNFDLVFRQEFDKVNWKLFTHKVALFVLSFLYIKDIVMKV